MNFSADAINGLFELAGGFAILLSVIKLHQDKLVRGVSWPHVAFFAFWGLWNLFYYPSLDQWFSFAGGLWLMAVNLFYVCQLIHYTIMEELNG